MKKQKTNRREFLKLGAAGIASVEILKNIKLTEKVSADSTAELTEATVFDLQNKMKAGELSARRIVEAYLEKIREIDPKIHSVIEINPDALTIADQMDKERKRGKSRGLMHGIPVLIKDNIDTADKMKTTAGSLALVDAPTPKHDAFVVEQLRKAGAVIVGKTNLSEWANFRSTKSISGWSGRGLQTNNPYILTENPCGSSAGTGAAISANLAAVGIGTETNGSIICPATRSGIVGIKPTLGLVSRSGIIPIAHTQDTAGPMCRTVADAAILLGAIVGRDKEDAITGSGTKGEKDYSKFLDANGLKNARIAGARIRHAPRSRRHSQRAARQRRVPLQCRSFALQALPAMLAQPAFIAAASSVATLAATLVPRLFRLEHARSNQDELNGYDGSDDPDGYSGAQSTRSRDPTRSALPRSQLGDGDAQAPVLASAIASVLEQQLWDVARSGLDSTGRQEPQQAPRESRSPRTKRSWCVSTLALWLRSKHVHTWSTQR